MRKSSLGKRGTAAVPVRIPSLCGMLPEVSEGGANKGNCVRSMIPRPSRSRSSSVDHNLAVLNRPMTAFNTPVAATPMQGLCASIMNKRGFQEPRSKMATKDMRPLSDKSFQTLAIQNIHNYFKRSNAMDISRIPKTLSSCTFTLKLFVEMSQHLLSRFFPSEVINMTNYTEKIPILAKNLGYPNIVKKSWLVTANSPHSLPQVIGFLSWLVDVVIAMSDCIPEVMFPRTEKNIEPPIEENCEGKNEYDIFTSERMLQYYMDCYAKFKEGLNHEFEDQQLRQEGMNKLKVNDSDFKVLQDKLLALQQELEKPEIVREVAENKELQDTKAALLNELNTIEESLQQKKSHYNRQQQKVEELQRSIATLDSGIEKGAGIMSQMSEHLKKQRYTPEDVAQKEKRIAELTESIKLDRNSIEMWTTENYALDLEMTNIRTKLNVVLKDYTTPIIKNADMFPELEDLKVQVNLLKQDADEQLQEVASRRDSYLKNLQAEVKEKEAIHDEKKEAVHALDQKIQQLSEKLSQENENLEDHKRELAVLECNFRSQKQNLMETLKQQQDELATAKEDMSNSVALEKKLQELLEVDRKVTEHTDSIHVDVEKHLKEAEEMYQEYANKIRDAVQPFIEIRKNTKH